MNTQNHMDMIGHKTIMMNVNVILLFVFSNQRAEVGLIFIRAKKILAVVASRDDMNGAELRNVASHTIYKDAA